MKNKFVRIFLLLISIFWLGCSNNTETPSIDCSLSDLSLTILSQTDSDCGDPGSVTVQATGGTPPYLYSSDGIKFQSSETLNDLFAGTYNLTVKDTDGCTASQGTTVAALSGSVSLSVDFSSPDCGSSNGTITANASGGVSPLMYSLNGGAPQTSNVFTGVSNGSNTVSVEDADNCQVERTVAVTTGISLAQEIMPIISSNCAVTGCHNGSRSPDLRTSAAVINNASRIKTRTTARTMPPSDRPDLAQEDIDKIACWVDDGAPDN